jgi:prepilin-type N-terminal cleavage/methylation domain-containing protein
MPVSEEGGASLLEIIQMKQKSYRVAMCKISESPTNATSTAKNLKCRKGFTFVEIAVVLAVILVVASIVIGALRNGREQASRARCDTQLKGLALALETFRQEQGQYPATLNEIVTKKYLLNTESFHCPSDPRPLGTYADYYIPRAPKNPNPGKAVGVPMIVCPFHEAFGNHGGQAFAGRITQQFATRPATLVAATGTSIIRPGKSSVSATAGLQLHGGDRIVTTGGGSAKIQYADDSFCEIQGNSDITVLQSFIQGSGAGSSYFSLMRQSRGTITYNVKSGNNFEVVTPTATAGALGTKFTITVATNNATSIRVRDGQVYLTTLKKIGLAPDNTLYNILPDLPGLRLLGGLGDLLGGLF